ncbi:MAG: type II toxin-antitoxin system RelE/ParE family toxin [Sulfuricella sp.]|nr:type II toxin-antitoxin system RelE/ParE family toxin [Sulfuricella sp.]
MKRLIRKERADADVQKAIDNFILTAPEYALEFVDSLEQAYRHIQQHPGSGSPRYAHELNLPGLRFWRCRRFPYLVFYVELVDRIEIWRVFHSHRDIPASLQNDG